MENMTGRQRLLATLAGEKTDRAPVWLRDQFQYGGRFPLRTEKTLDVCMLDPFADGWVNQDPHMQRIWDKQREIGPDIIKEFVVPGKVCNRLLCTPPSQFVLVSDTYVGDQHVTCYELETPKGPLRTTTVCKQNVSTMWQEKYLVEDEVDIEKIMSVPFAVEPIDRTVYDAERQLLGEDGIMMMQIDTPFIAVSGLMDFGKFLLLCGMNQELLRKLCDVAFERIYQVVERLLQAGMGDLFRLNGSEQATPPMNSPQVYKDFVYPYEKELAALIHKYGKFVSVHSHGRVSRNLPLMVDAGIDMVDPIEPMPAGDISFQDARKLTDKRIVLAGNLQFSELEVRDTDYVNRMVAQIFADGHDKIVLTPTASPITFMSERLRDNYLAMLTCVQKYGMA